MESTAVRVAQITRGELEALVRDRVNAALGSRRVREETVETLVAEVLEGSANFLVEWEGDEESVTLRGVDLRGVRIGSIENAFVRSIDGEPIGSIEHLVRSGGETGREHKALIILF